MTNEFLCSVERRVIQKDIGSFFDLFAKLVKTFHNNGRIYFAFYNIREQLIVQIKKT